MNMEKAFGTKRESQWSDPGSFRFVVVRFKGPQFLVTSMSLSHVLWLFLHHLSGVQNLFPIFNTFQYL